MIGFALGFIAVIWLAAWQQIETERHAVERDMAQDTANLALVFEHNIARSLSEIDRVALFMRQTYERSGGTADWETLINERYAVHEQTLQIAIINARGLLIASNVGPLPAKPLDLSDREHFRVHVGTQRDELFISRPVLGRASGKWSVQLTRRFLEASGELGGVIVISLDPSLLSKAYSGLEMGEGSGLALVGLDDIVRAGAGSYADALGRGLTQDLLPQSLTQNGSGSQLVVEKRNGATRIIAARRIAGYPLFVLVAGRNLSQDSAWLRNQRNYLAGAAALTVIVLITMLAAMRNRRRHEIEITHLARHDSLTNLYNRARFREKLDRALEAPAVKMPFALHLIDLDRFKHVNDTYGHPVGDKLLRAVADRLRANLRHGDLVGRLGGDEFAILQGRLESPTDAAGLADRICRVLSEPYSIDGLRLEIGASIGIAIGGRDGGTTPEMMKAADLALYCAKSEGRRTYRFFNDAMSASARARSELEDNLRAALEQGQFELYYQPIVDIGAYCITGYEALLRWRHPTRGMVPPVEFIPIAEETGLIFEIGAWALETACREMALRQAPLKVAVNFSPIQFRHASLAETVRTALARSGLAASRLEIEITESTLMQRDSVTIQLLRDLRSLGVQIAMDDFGTGYSSLSCLHTYPINCIKIDRSFVKTLGETDSAAAIVRAITTLAAALGMTTTAEGVETRAQLEELALLGCTEAQGYYFSKPMPAAEVLPPPAFARAAAQAA